MSNKIIFASTISEIQQSDVFMTVKARICEAPQANLNGARVTEAFIDEIVGNEARYVGLPLYADKKALLNGNYTRLGHLYDTKTGEFHSTQIGSFYKFEKQTTQNGCALVGFARIPKRNRKLSKAISELFADNALKFSFELSVGEYEELDDDTILIDASENNYLEGTAIVTYPACEEAVALELVAQKADETRKGDEEMAEVENKAEVVETEASQPELAEDKKVESSPETAENVSLAEEKTEKNVTEAENAEDENAACKKKEKASEEEDKAETAAVVTHEFHEERHTSVAYDTETGKEVSQTVIVETRSTDSQEGTLVETVDGVHVAEKEIAEDDPPADNNSEEQEADPEPDPVPEETDQDSYESGKKKKTAEQLIGELIDIVNGLKDETASLKTEIAELKAKKEPVAVNPFMGELTAKSKYTLLEETPPTQTYTLV